MADSTMKSSVAFSLGVVSANGMTALANTLYLRLCSTLSSMGLISAPTANSTLTPSGGILVNILASESMAKVAMCFYRVSCAPPITAQDINAERYIFNVRWIDAMLSFAKMVAGQVFRYWAIEHPTGGDVRENIKGLSFESAIAVCFTGNSPEPAWCSVKRDCWIYFNAIEEIGKKFACGLNYARIFTNHLSLRHRFDGLGFHGLTHREALSF